MPHDPLAVTERERAQPLVHKPQFVTAVIVDGEVAVVKVCPPHEQSRRCKSGTMACRRCCREIFLGA